MTGIKNMKWSVEKRRPEMQKCNLQLTKEEYSAVQSIVQEKEWCTAKVLHKLVIAQLENLGRIK